MTARLRLATGSSAINHSHSYSEGGVLSQSASLFFLILFTPLTALPLLLPRHPCYLRHSVLCSSPCFNSIDDNNIGDDGMAAIDEALKHNKTLTNVG
jgi:hypothetical protein